MYFLLLLSFFFCLLFQVGLSLSLYLGWRKGWCCCTERAQCSYKKGHGRLYTLSHIALPTERRRKAYSLDTVKKRQERGIGSGVAWNREHITEWTIDTQHDGKVWFSPYPESPSSLFLDFFSLFFFLSFSFFFNYYFRDLSELTLRFSNLIAFGWEIELVRRIKAPSPLYRYLFVWGFYFSSFLSRFFYILFPPRLYFSCTLLLHPLIFWSAIIFSNPWPEEKHAPRVHRSRALPSPPPNPPPSLLGAARINRLLKSPGSSRVCVIVFWDEENQVGSRFSSVLLLSLWWSMSILLDERRGFLAASCRPIRFRGWELGSNFSSKKSKLQSMGWKSTERRGSCELETRMLCIAQLLLRLPLILRHRHPIWSLFGLALTPRPLIGEMCLPYDVANTNRSCRQLFNGRLSTLKDANPVGNRLPMCLRVCVFGCSRSSFWRLSTM